MEQRASASKPISVPCLLSMSDLLCKMLGSSCKSKQRTFQSFSFLRALIITLDAVANENGVTTHDG